MHIATHVRCLLGAASLGTLTILGALAPSAAFAQAPAAAEITVPAMPMARALEAIGAQSGASVTYDPDAVRQLTSRPVNGATSAREALQQAIAGTGLAISPTTNGGFDVVTDIVVIAQRDEAETSVLVRQSSTSDRNGLGLREQPRNNQVISAKTIADQQALSISEVLRNAGAVSTLENSPQSGSTYSVRGFPSGGLVNGLSGSGNFGVSAGSSQPIANIERVEVLKGPDALLVGFDNLGGNVNVVTKKPSADPFLIVTGETGSYGLFRGVIDANSRITDDGKLSGRVVASAQTANRNYGGYIGNKDYLFAPSVRFKDARTDILIGASLNKSTNGIVPFTAFDQQTGEIFERDPSVPLYSRDQAIRVRNDRFYFDITRELTPWVTLVTRGLHDETTLGLDVYPIEVNSSNLARVAIRGSGQVGKSDAIDSYLRFKFGVGQSLQVKLNVGYNYSSGYFEPRSSDSYVLTAWVPFGSLNSLPVQPRPAADQKSFRLGSKQHGVYGQALLDFGRFKVLGGVRRIWYRSDFEFFGCCSFPEKDKAAVPNFGAIFDVTDDISVFANFVKGNAPVTQTDIDGNVLPNIKSTNKEAGVKIDLFDKRATVNLSYFDLLQDNTIIFVSGQGLKSAPGQRGRGIDLNIAGEVMPGWTVQGSWTHVNYRYLSPSAFRTDVAAQPKNKYSLYSNYRTKISDEISGGFGVGFYGRSSSFGDGLGDFTVPSARQVDANVFVTLAGFDINLGVRNLFDRRNYGATSVIDFVPVDEPRNVRLTISRRIF